MNFKNTIKSLAGIAETALVLGLGGIVAGILVRFVSDPALGDQMLAMDGSNAFELAGFASWVIALKFLVMIALGLGVLKWGFKKGRRDIGLTRAGKPLGSLVGAGVLLFAIASLPAVALIFLNTLVPFGAGLANWDMLNNVTFTPGVVVFFLMTGMILPPLLEETAFRGYVRVRYAESFGALGAVILSGVFFALGHGQYFIPDGLALGVLLAMIFGAISWAYVTYKTGSLIPAMVAHALANMPLPQTRLNLGVLLAVMLVILFLKRQTVKRWLCDFAGEHKAYDQKGALFLGILFVAAVMAITHLAPQFLMPLLGVLVLLIVLGVVFRKA